MAERKKKNQAEISTRAFSLESPSNKSVRSPTRKVFPCSLTWSRLRALAAEASKGIFRLNGVSHERRSGLLLSLSKAAVKVLIANQNYSLGKWRLYRNDFWFVSKRLLICIETTLICIETTCIETTLYRNDRKPSSIPYCFSIVKTWRAG